MTSISPRSSCASGSRRWATPSAGSPPRRRKPARRPPRTRRTSILMDMILEGDLDGVERCDRDPQDPGPADHLHHGLRRGEFDHPHPVRAALRRPPQAGGAERALRRAAGGQPRRRQGPGKRIKGERLAPALQVFSSIGSIGSGAARGQPRSLSGAPRGTTPGGGWLRPTA